MHQPAEAPLHNADAEATESRDLSASIAELATKLGQTALEVVSDEPKSRVTDKSLDRLTSIESLIFELLGQGLNLREISDLRGTTLQSTKFHLARLYRKLDVRDKTEASLLAAGIQTDLLKQKESGLREAALYIKAASILIELGAILPDLQIEPKADLVVLQSNKSDAPEIEVTLPDDEKSDDEPANLPPPLSKSRYRRPTSQRPARNFIAHEQRTRPLEYDKHKRMVEAAKGAVRDLARLKIISDEDERQVKLFFENQDERKELYTKGLISYIESETGNFSVESFISALLSKTSWSGKILSDERTRPGGLTVIRDEVDRYFKSSALARTSA